MYKVVLLRHGESVWNQENRFTGWTDVDLTAKGRDEARVAGRLLKEAGFGFDFVFTSLLKRAILTSILTMIELDQLWVPVERSWRLNERHYGALQGLNKAETAAKHGEEQVKIWRRAYAIAPPPLELTDPRHPSSDQRYKKLDPAMLPCTESLKDTVARFVPYWQERITPRVRNGERVLIVAHGNSLRALVKYLDGISDDAITELNIPTGIPLIYELDADLKPIRNYYLGDPDIAKKAAAAVAKEGNRA